MRDLFFGKDLGAELGVRAMNLNVYGLKRQLTCPAVCHLKGSDSTLDIFFCVI